MLRICVDSNSQLPAALARRFRIAIVPLVVEIDGREYREGLDLDADGFYAFWEGGTVPKVTTSQPSPGDFRRVYEEMIAEGATGILSIHISEDMSGTLNSARIAGRDLAVPIRHVDTGTASFGIACCAWAAAEAIADGADLDEAAEVAISRSARLGTAFIVGVPRLAEQSGRAEGLGIGAAAEEGLPVVAMREGTPEVLATVQSRHEAVVAMVDFALSFTPSMPGGLRIAVGTSDAPSANVSKALTELLESHGDVADVVQYRIGPSVGAYTGPGTSGLFVF